MSGYHPLGARVPKHIKGLERRERREAKEARRRARGQKPGPDILIASEHIEALPETLRGLARTVSYGGAL